VKNHTVKTCPVEAVNVQDNLLLYKVTFIFQCTVATFYRWCGKIYNLLVEIFWGFHVSKLTRNHLFQSVDWVIH